MDMIQSLCKYMDACAGRMAGHSVHVCPSRPMGDEESRVPRRRSGNGLVQYRQHHVLLLDALFWSAVIPHVVSAHPKTPTRCQLTIVTMLAKLPLPLPSRRHLIRHRWAMIPRGGHLDGRRDDGHLGDGRAVDGIVAVGTVKLRVRGGEVRVSRQGAV